MNEQDFQKMVGEMEEFFERITDASIQYRMGGLGGGKDYDRESIPAKYRPFVEQYLYTDDSSCLCLAGYMRDAGYLDCRGFKKEWGDRFGFLADKNDRESFESIDEVATILTESMQNLYKERKS